MASHPASSAAASTSFLTPLGAIAESELSRLIRVTLITMIAILPVLIGVPLILWRYRRSRRTAAYRPDWAFSKPLEIAMWGVPIAIIFTLGIWLWQDTTKFDPYKPLGVDPLQVQVVGLDWKWLFIYPDQDVASVGELAIPVGRSVSLRLTTDTVMQSFMIPALAGQIYAMPGMRTKLNFRADRPGSALGENTQYNGEGFAKQKFVLRALSAAEWDTWLSTAHASPLVLDTANYARLAQRGSLADAREILAPDQRGGSLLFSHTRPGLFDRIVNRYHQGTPITGAQQPGAPVHNPG